MTAVAAAAKLYNIDQKITNSVISTYTVNNGRMENFMLGDRETTLNLAKNPVGANMTLRVMNETSGEKSFFSCSMTMLPTVLTYHGYGI